MLKSLDDDNLHDACVFKYDFSKYYLFPLRNFYERVLNPSPIE